MYQPTNWTTFLSISSPVQYKNTKVAQKLWNYTKKFSNQQKLDSKAGTCRAMAVAVSVAMSVHEPLTTGSIYLFSLPGINGALRHGSWVAVAVIAVGIGNVLLP